MAAGLGGLIDGATGVITGVLIPLAYVICVVFFLWGMVLYIKNSAGGKDAREAGKRVMLYGVIGLFVASSVWGIVNLLRSDLGIPGINKLKSE